MKPLYKHDCDDVNCCKFITSKDGVDYWSYGEGHGILKRYSDKPQDNTTYPLYILIKQGCIEL